MTKLGKIMRYLSTRGQALALSFDEAVLAGLASDGGLYVPEAVPQLSPADIANLHDLPYPALAARLLAPFTVPSFNEATLQGLFERAYASFSHPAMAPLYQIGHQRFLVELFHGPTLAFKDFALQFLGVLLDELLKARGERVTILGATSGDTGSAAIAGCRGRENISIVILHPKGRVSEVQRRQMTTVTDTNVHNLAIEGTFDDCQAIVKTLFTDEQFRRAQRLVAVNSINWARIMAQVVYYFSTALSFGAPARRIAFSVPTGNFGDIYAGYIAKRMGLPMGRLIIATNQNDILARCVESGVYARKASASATLSPSMDIQVASNFERLLFDLHGRDGEAVRALMEDFAEKGSLRLSAAQLLRLRRDFRAHSVSDEETIAAMQCVYRETGEMIDPHTAVGVAAAEKCHQEEVVPVAILATAHPAKFPEAVEKACGALPALPSHLAELMQGKERCTALPGSAQAVKDYIQAKL